MTAVVLFGRGGILAVSPILAQREAAAAVGETANRFPARIATSTSTCPGAGTPPTAVDLTVSSLPIVVSSTTADYFVLYVKHDLGDGDMRDLPVSVTLGQAGSTTLGWGVAGLPASRYRVEKYQVADPADVDGDCIDDLLELNGDPTANPAVPTNNPVNPAPDIDYATAGLNRLSTIVEYFGIRWTAPGHEYVKLAVYDLDAELPGVLFMNTKVVANHPAFVIQLGLSLDETIPVELDRRMVGGVLVYRFWLPVDTDAVTHAKAVPWLRTAIGASMPLICDVAPCEWRYHISASLKPKIASWIPKYRQQHVPLEIENVAVAPTLTVAGGAAVTEGGSAEFTVTAVPAPASSLVATLTIADDAVSDFVASDEEGDQSVTISGGSSTATWTVSTVDDSLDEPDGAVSAAVKAGPGYTVGSPGSAAVQVADDDLPQVWLALASSSVAEGGSATVEARLSATLAVPVTVPLLVTGGDAGDYSPPQDIVISASSLSGTTTLPTVRDEDIRDEILTVALDKDNLPSVVVAAQPDSVALTIEDLTPEASLAVSVNPVAEGESTKVEAKLTKIWSSDLVIPLATTAGTAEPGDYAAPASVTVPAGAKSGTASLSTVDDQDTDDETLTVEFGPLPSGIAEGSPRAVEIVVRDGTPTSVPEVTLEASPSTVEEGAAATVTARLGKALAGGVTIPLIVTPGSAEPGDYDVPAAVVIAAGQRAGTSVLRTRDDADTDDETLTVALGALPPEARAGSPDRVEIAIRDADEDPPPPNPGGGSPPPPPAPPPPPGGPAKASFEADAECAGDLCRAKTGQRVRFTNASTGAARSPKWDFGDGATSRSVLPSHAWPSPGFYEVSLTVSGGGAESTASRMFLVEAAEPAGDCSPDAETLCLGDSRFEVAVDWRAGDSGNAGGGPGLVIHAGTNDSGLFSFFDRTNWEVLVKVLDGCALNGAFWVFAASTTDLAFTLRVRDTVTGETREYVNEPGVAAPAVADAKAFEDACANL